MNISTGLFDYSVLQRNRKDVSEASISGTAVDGTVTATWHAAGGKPGRPVAVGTCRKGRFTALLKGIPTGGPYVITLQILAPRTRKPVDTLSVRDVLVGDVWVAAGQSNMQGAGRPAEGPRAHSKVRAFYMDDRWAPAQDPIHNMWECVDQVHMDLSGGQRPGKDTYGGVGPAVTFAQRTHELTGVPQGVLACAHGGTCMSQWDPKKKKLGTKSLYGAMLRRVKKNGGKVAGVIWYQGCSEASPEASAIYIPVMKAFIGAMRRDFASPSLPVAVVQIGRHVDRDDENGRGWNSVQHQQYELPTVIPHTTVVPAVDLPLVDGIHVNAAGQIELGNRLAYAMQVLRVGPKAGKAPIRLRRLRLEKEERNWHRVILEFDNLVGPLQASGRPTGFSIFDGNDTEFVYDTTLDGNKVVLHTMCDRYAISNKILHHGKTRNPYCNITDAAGRPIPLFGPLFVDKPRALGPLLSVARHSLFFPSAGKLNALAYPASKKALKLKSRQFPLTFLRLHDEMAALAPKDVLVYFACDFDCSEPMKLAASLGYDGPIKAWVDGKQVFHDPKGTNPSVADMAQPSFQVGKGRHELLIALGSNHGNAWGVWLAFERLDIPTATMIKGPAHWVMPTVLG